MSTKLLTSCHIISPDFEAFDAAVLIDGDGVILARGLHGDELQEKLAE